MEADASRRMGAAWSPAMSDQTSSGQSHQPGAPSALWQFDPRRHARSLYWRGWGVTQIAEEFVLHGVVGDKVCRGN